MIVSLDVGVACSCCAVAGVAGVAVGNLFDYYTIFNINTTMIFK